MKTIPLTKGYVAIVDDEDYALVSKFKWHTFNNNGRGTYAIANMEVDGKMTTVRMHRFITNPSRSEVVDHINRNGLDNRRGNLRAATRSTNAANSKHRADRSTSPYRGVYFEKEKKLYRAQIRVNGKLFGLGRYKDPKLAAEKYDAEAVRNFGEFAVLNFPEVRSCL
jgi:hypothetical protein